MSTTSSPQDRIVAFLDILGFKDMVALHMEDQEFIKKLDDTIGFAESVFGGRAARFKNISCRMFSDCICASIEVTGRNIVDFIYAIEAVQFTLSIKGVFLRGAISTGRHYESSHLIFSNALINAYEMESRYAVYPRVIVHENVLDEISKVDDWKSEAYEWKEWKGAKQFIDLHFINHDGIAYVNYMADLLSIDRTANMLEYAYSHKAAVAQWLCDGQNRDLPSAVTDKHRWLVEYHNQSCQRHVPWEEELVIQT